MLVLIDEKHSLTLRWLLPNLTVMKIKPEPAGTSTNRNKTIDGKFQLTNKKIGTSMNKF